VVQWPAVVCFDVKYISLRLPYEIRQIVMALWTLLSQLVLLLLCLYNKDNSAKSLHPVDLLYTVASPAVIHITLD
jgi:hypothetical protein